MGARAGEIPPPSPGTESVGPLNSANYRITDADRLGEGGQKQKYRQNLAAIRTLRQVQAESRPPTTKEKSVIAKYVGWGGLPQVFATPQDAPQWRAEQEELAGLLEPDEMNSARATVLNAHYTSPTVIRGMYAALDRLGFKHGRILEPACGLGHFFGLMPEPMAARSRLTGVEIDPLTARLAKALYPDADIRSQAFENVTLPTNGFDLAVSNVPFGDYAPFDPKLNARKFHIHDYFFVAAAERVRPGGLVAFVTSRGTLDKQYPHLREAVAKSCDVIGAIRLPNTAFKKNANTEVTTDIVFLRKRAPGEKPGGQPWRESRPWGADANPIFLNEYFHAHPEMMLGRLERVEHGMYGRAGEDVARLERQVAAMEQDLATRVDTHGEKFQMVGGKKTYTERADAGAALVYLAADHRDDHLAGRAGTVVLGELAGFKLEYRSTWPDKVTLRGAAEYTASARIPPSGGLSEEHGIRLIGDWRNPT